jgi:hypothetical protein
VAYSLFTNQTPVDANASDGAPGLTLATRIVISANGEITGIRWYFPATLPSGTVTGLLYSYTGMSLIDSKDFSAPVAGTWNVATLDTPVAVTAGDEFFAAIWTPDRYVATGGFFTSSGLVNADLEAPIDDSNDHNGQFHVGATPAYPNNSFNAASYFADLVFEPAGAATVTPDAIVATTTIPAVTVSASATATPATITAVTTIHAPTAQASSRATPATITASTTMPAVTAAASSTVTPATITGTTTMPAPAASSGVNATPATIAATTTIHAPTVQTGTTVTAGTIAGVATVAEPALATGSTVTPATIAGIATIPSADVTSPATITPDAIAATTTIPEVGVTGGAIVTPATIAAVATIHAPIIAVANTGARPVLVASLSGPTLVASLG